MDSSSWMCNQRRRERWGKALSGCGPREGNPVVAMAILPGDANSYGAWVQPAPPPSPCYTVDQTILWLF